MASNGSPPGPTCQSCGTTDEPLEAVHRIYLETGEDGTLRPSPSVPGVERWCRACRAVYPHEPVRG